MKLVHWLVPNLMQNIHGSKSVVADGANAISLAGSGRYSASELAGRDHVHVHLSINIGVLYASAS